MPRFGLSRRLAAEGLGTLLLVAAVVGSGIMGVRTGGGNAALALLGNTLATGAILVVLIFVFGPISGGHFNPAVTLAFWLRREIAATAAGGYVAVQILGGLLGVAVAHSMFNVPVMELSATLRAGPSQWFAEFVASLGLVLTILGTLRFRPQSVPYAVGLFISAGYWFTSSTSFANPAVTIARAFTDSFSGIALSSVPAFIAAQLIGAVAATALFAWIAKPMAVVPAAAANEVRAAAE
ncbi:MAG: MIP/aquaporin family protein [Alphaproteobacteria bacterium]